MTLQFNWESPFIGTPKLREKSNGIKIWDQTMNPYPREFFHMGRLRFPCGKKWGSVEHAAALMLKAKLAKDLSFKGNISWRYYQNHFNETPTDPVVRSIAKFIQTNKLGKTKLRSLLSKHKFNGMPDLLGKKGKNFEVWEVKAPLDNHNHPKSIAVLEDLAEYGFNSNLLCLHEFGKTKTELTNERKEYLANAQKAYSELLISPVGEKVLKNIIKPTLKNTLDVNSVNRIFSKYESGVSYFVYALVYYIERANEPREKLPIFTLTQNEVVYLSRQLFLCGSYHWWRIPLLFMMLVSDEGENQEYIELIKDAVRWEISFRTVPELWHLKEFDGTEEFFLNYYKMMISRAPFGSAEEKAKAQLATIGYHWRPIYYSKPLR